MSPSIEASLPSTGGGVSSAAVRFADLLKHFRGDLDRELAAFFTEKRQAAEGTLVELAGRVEALIQGGGKRLRPALVHFTHRACGGRRREAARPVALATELLHAYLLIHDDIMDHAELRRGEPTVHRRFRELHRSSGWPGDGGDFGRSAAILAGDLAYTWAVELFALGRRRALEAGTFDTAALDHCFSAMCEEVIGGQFLEMRLPFAAALEDPEEGEIVKALQLKSGRYSVERPIELGALLAGADEETRDALRRYGAAAGEAFQLQDDVLGTFGDAERVGKSVASDLTEGKRTLLIHFALQGASEADADHLGGLLGRSELDRREIEEARRIIRQSGGLDRVLGRIRDRLEQARRALSELPLTPEGRAFFDGMIDYLRERKQ